jgi:signal transduction histidine kinase
VIAAQEIHSQRRFLGELRNVNGRAFRFCVVGLASAGREGYLEDFPGEVGYAPTKAGRWSVTALDREGNQLPAPLTEESGRTERAAALSFGHLDFLCRLGTEWRGRVFVFEPSWQGTRKRSCAFCWICFARWGRRLQRLSAAPATAAGGAAERARFARELHDGAVQSLIAVEMQVDVLRVRRRILRKWWRRIGPHSRAAARGSFEAAGTDAADEVHRCGCAKILECGDRHGGAV